MGIGEQLTPWKTDEQVHQRKRWSVARKSFRETDQRPKTSGVGMMLHFDLDVNPCWEIEGGQRFDRFCVWIKDVNDALMNTHFKLFARIFVHKR